MRRESLASAMSTKNASRDCKKKRSASARSRTPRLVLAKKRSEGRPRRGSALSVRPSRRQRSRKKESEGFGTRRTSRKKSMKDAGDCNAKRTKGTLKGRTESKPIRRRLRNGKESTKRRWRSVSALKKFALGKSKSA